MKVVLINCISSITFFCWDKRSSFKWNEVLWLKKIEL